MHTFFLRGNTSWISFIRARWDIICAGFVIFLAVAWSLPSLETKPKLWTDEAVSINIARSFSTHGILSVQVTPDTFWESAYLVQSTGYPVTVPLAAFFKLFGYGFDQARIFMLVWMSAALAAVFFVARKLFSKYQALASLLLVATFASFYANGRTVVGEIPGFVLLLVGLYLLLVRRHYFFTGILWGLAVVAKPSVFGLLIPAAVVTMVIQRTSFKEFLTQVFAVASGMVPAAFLWIVLVLEDPFKATIWRSIGAFYKNPYSSDITQNMVNNMAGFFHSTTLIYFSGLLALIILARLLLKEKNMLSFLYTLIIVYACIAFFYYLRSPGYLRYVLIAELLILFVVPHAASIVIPWATNLFSVLRASRDRIIVYTVGILVVIQAVHLFIAADISSSDSPQKTATYINGTFPGRSVGLVNVPEIGVFAEPLQTFLTLNLLGLPPIGETALFMEKLPGVVVSRSSGGFTTEESTILRERYAAPVEVDGYAIFAKQ